MRFSIEGNQFFRNLVNSYKAFVLDLDNTLYDETLYLFPAYKEIGRYLEGKYNHIEKDSWLFFRDHFQQSGRKNLFDKAINHFGLSPSEKEHFLFILRTHKIAGIELFEGIDALLLELRSSGKQVVILTNGNPVQQKNKIESIRWPAHAVDLPVIYANEFEPKPSPEGLYRIMKDYNLKATDIVFIGDSQTDQECAVAAGVKYVNIHEL